MSDTTLKAFMLGWNMARLYATPSPRATQSLADLPARLPGTSGLTTHRLLIMRVEQVYAASADLTGHFSPDAQELLIKILEAVRAPGSNVPAIPHQRRQVLDLHIAITTSLTASLPSAGKAYGLGRALPDTCRPQQSPEDLAESFAERRVTSLQGWLYDLEDHFPPRCAATVRASLDAWVDYFQRTSAQQSDWTHGRVSIAIRRQGQIWRSFLSGERDPSHDLPITTYLVATKLLASIHRRLLNASVAAVAPLLSCLAAPFVVLPILTTSLADEAWATVTTWLAATGLFGFTSTRIVLKQTKRLMLHVERPFWEESLNIAIADLHTLRPAKRDRLSVPVPVR